MVQLEDELLTVAEAAKLLKVTRHTIYRWVAEGRVPAVRHSRRVIRLRRGDLAKLHGSYSSQELIEHPGRKLLRYAGIMTPEEAELVFGAIMRDREASRNDP
jgi:excisionase family DNA binding protein